MKQHIPEEFSTRLIDWSPFVIMGNTVPPRVPDEDEEDEKTKRTTPTNRRSCASRTKTRIACSWQSAYSISHELGCERRSAAQKTLGRRTERRADRAPCRV
jgi:hypothetical protein